MLCPQVPAEEAGTSLEEVLDKVLDISQVRFTLALFFVFTLGTKNACFLVRLEVHCKYEDCNKSHQ